MRTGCFLARSCPEARCKSDVDIALSGMFGRFSQAATAGSLTTGSSPKPAMVSSVMWRACCTAHSSFCSSGIAPPIR
jgi:hypothetical protein